MSYHYAHEPDRCIEMSEHNTDLYPALYRFACYPPRGGNLEDAIYVHGLEGDEDEGPEEVVAQKFARDENEKQVVDADELERDLLESLGYSV
jgi:hypothetical protein